MLNAISFLRILKESGVNFFSGVADSTLSNLINLIQNEKEVRHLIAANEGLAVAGAVGNHLATGEIPCVYLQNSGLGNAVNPISSLVDKSVYDVPMIFVVGWRGEPDSNDEPQHKRMGAISNDLLVNLGIDVFHVNTETRICEIENIVVDATKAKKRIAFLVSRGVFDASDSQQIQREITVDPVNSSRSLLKEILLSSSKEDIFFSTTGYLSRELHNLSVEIGRPTSNNFYGIGSMGHISALALEYSLAKKDQRVIILDGDGALLMHLGVLSHFYQGRAKNIAHIVFDNRSYESTGGQPSPSHFFDLVKILRAAKSDFFLESMKDLKTFLTSGTEGHVLAYIRSTNLSICGSPRNKILPAEQKANFMKQGKGSNR